MADDQRGMPSAVREMQRVRERLGEETAALLAPLEEAVDSSGLVAALDQLDREHLLDEESRHDPDILSAWATDRAREAAEQAAAHRSTNPNPATDPITRACEVLWHRVSAIRGGRAAYEAALARGIVPSEWARTTGED